MTSVSPSSTHVVRIRATTSRPAFWKLAEHLWGTGCDIDSDGDSRTPDDEEWPELTLSLRGKPDQHVTVDPLPEEPSTLAVRSTDPGLAKKAAAYLDGWRP